MAGIALPAGGRYQPAAVEPGIVAHLGDNVADHAALVVYLVNRHEVRGWGLARLDLNTFPVWVGVSHLGPGGIELDLDIQRIQAADIIHPNLQ